MSRTIKSIISNTFLITLTAFILHGCGGGSGTTAPAITPPVIPPVSVTPTVSISSSQTSVLVNEQVTINWKATDGQTCALSGDGAGNVNTTDSKTVSFGSIGGKVITIICNGLSKSVTASATINVTAATTYSVPVDISKITYPDSYQTVTTKTSDINTDPCNLNLSVVTYPQSWLGNYPLPKVAGAPLKLSISRGMSLKDIMLHDNPAFILNGAPDVPNGCKGDLQAEFVKTIAKLKSLGVDYIYPPQWHWASINPDGTWYIMKAEDSFGPLSDADLTFLTNTAHAAGIKVVMLNQIQGMVNNSSSPAYQPASTLANFQKWFAAYQAYLNERSKFFQSIGVDIWEIGCSSCMFHDEGDGSPEAISLFSQEYAKAVINMKANYSGKTLMSTPSWLLEQTDFLKVIDVLGLGIWTQPFNEMQSASLTVEAYKTAIDNGGWSSGISYWDQFGKTLMFWVGIQSRANALTLPGYLEETVCTAAIGDLNPSPTACAQRDTKTDFSLQAIVYEASFEKLNETNLKSNIIVVTGDYWETESLMPETAFPNLAMSPRNKPAEGIVKMWFAK